MNLSAKKFLSIFGLFWPIFNFLEKGHISYIASFEKIKNRLKRTKNRLEIFYG